MKNLDKYYKMSKKIIKNNNDNRNYEKLNNINEILINNGSIINDIKEIVIDNDIINNKVKNIIHIFNKMNKNYIKAEIEIKEDDINKEIRIINSFEEFKSLYGWDDKNENEYENEKEIKEKCKIKINNKIIPFSYKYKFNKKGKYIIEYLFSDNLTKTDFMFYECKSLSNIDLTNFNTENITYMSYMLSRFGSLPELDLINIDNQIPLIKVIFTVNIYLYKN